MRTCSVLFLLVVLLPVGAVRADHVVLLHGLVRSSGSMESMRDRLSAAGYAVVNVDYPSRTAAIDLLADEAIGRALAICRAQGGARIHFVTHSLGGILVRSYLARHAVPELGRVVMLAPPNGGSEIVDTIGDWAVFGWINGPAGRELGTGSESVPNRLGGATFPLGVVAGNRSINWINSVLIPGPDDGKVSIERTKLAGMADHVVIAATHPFIMRNPAAIRQVLAFLRGGAFERER